MEYLQKCAPGHKNATTRGIVIYLSASPPTTPYVVAKKVLMQG